MQEVSDFVLFLGRFHPLVVHLPIGFLMFALILELANNFTNMKHLNAAVPLALLFGAISGTVACILGYMLSQSGGYDEDMLNGHFWFGIGTTLLAFFAWALKSGVLKIAILQKAKPNLALLTVMVILLSVTGHYGGNLTHGEDYLVKYAPFREKEEPLPQLAKLEEATVYPYLVKPVFEAKCVSCHNESKKKGGLAMHTFEAMALGGDGGAIFTAGEVEGSELIRRITLPEHHDDVMPPEGKTPLTEQESALIKFWIEHGQANEVATLGATEVPEDVLAYAASTLGFAAAGVGQGSSEVLPTANPLNMDVVNTITAAGFKVRELIDGSGLVEITLDDNKINASNMSEWEEHFQSLIPVKDQILWADFGGNELSDTIMNQISGFTNLRKLVLDNTSITDAAIQPLASLNSLESLNIYNNNITNSVLPTLKKMTNLKKVYIWQTQISTDAIEQLSADSQLKVISGA
ncbi:c-type cytochrome domain-containing protein [Maribacter sp. R86514]|uniref:c-type cytochrome domain-containing protein n=1 Tax=Maribacter sp. R86514 TaxID=3093854 RepID=UPI0037C890F7